MMFGRSEKTTIEILYYFVVLLTREIIVILLVFVIGCVAALQFFLIWRGDGLRGTKNNKQTN